MARPLTLVMALRDGVEPAAVQKVWRHQQEALFAGLDVLGAAHFVSFAVRDGALLAFIVYDGELANFVEDFVEYAGAPLEQLLALTDEGADLRPLSQHVAELTAFVRANDLTQQPPNDALTMYSAYSYPAEQIIAMMPSPP